MSAITTVTELLGELAKKGFKHADSVTAKDMRVLEDVTNAFKRGEDVAEDSLKSFKKIIQGAVKDAENPVKAQNQVFLMMRKNGLLGNGDDALRNEVKLRKTLTSTDVAVAKETPLATVKETPLAKTEAKAKPKDTSKPEPELELEPKVETPKPHVDDAILKGPTVNERLAELTPGRFPREELDARLKALNEAAKEHGQIDASIRKAGSELGARKALDALENGEKITPKEMTAVQRHLQSQFEDYEKAMAKQAGKEVVEEGAKKEKTWWERAKSTLATAGIVGGAGLVAVNFLPKSWLPEIAQNWYQKQTTSQRAEIQQAERINTQQINANCLADGTAYGKDTNSCLPKLNLETKQYQPLTTDYYTGSLNEASKRYLGCAAEKIEAADPGQSATEDQMTAFEANVAKFRSDCANMTNAIPGLNGKNGADFQAVDRKLQAAINMELTK